MKVIFYRVISEFIVPKEKQNDEGQYQNMQYYLQYCVCKFYTHQIIVHKMFIQQ